MLEHTLQGKNAPAKRWHENHCESGFWLSAAARDAGSGTGNVEYHAELRIETWQQFLYDCSSDCFGKNGGLQRDELVDGIGGSFVLRRIE
jgi:hypothetical protein